MRTSTKFLIAAVCATGVALLSGVVGLLLCVAHDLGYAAAWPATFDALRMISGAVLGLGVIAAAFCGTGAVLEAD